MATTDPTIAIDFSVDRLERSMESLERTITEYRNRHEAFVAAVRRAAKRLEHTYGRRGALHVSDDLEAALRECEGEPAAAMETGEIQ